MTPSTQSLTAEELLRMPNDGNRHELVRGELRTMSPPGFRHGHIVSNIVSALAPFANKHRLGTASAGDPGLVLARRPDMVRAPDVAFIRAERFSQAGEPAGVQSKGAFGPDAGYWEGAPDLAVEVLSPNDTVFEVEEKTNDWLTLGCAMVVFVNDRTRTVTVHRPGRPVRTLRGTEVFEGEDLIPGFRLPLPKIFA